MRLTAEQFVQLIHGLRGNRAGHERRTTTRVGLRAKLDIRLKLGNRLGPFMMVWVRDISAGGMGLLSSTLVRVDSQFIAYLAEDSGPVLMQYTVRNVRRVGEQYIIGAQFERKLASEEEAMSGAPAASAAQPAPSDSKAA